jgi:hypothetical protein
MRYLSQAPSHATKAMCLSGQAIAAGEKAALLKLQKQRESIEHCLQVLNV